jgi:hypothetical protein
MRANEFIAENAGGVSTTSGSIAPIATPMGGVISRNGGHFFSGTKYTTDDATPNTPAEYKKYKKRKK